MEVFNQEQGYNGFSTPQPQRPFGLSFACVLSFINAGFQFLYGIIMFLSHDMMKKMINDDNYTELMKSVGDNVEETKQMLMQLLSVDKSYFLITALLYVASFVGVLYMWKMRKTGFHIYAIAQIVTLIVFVLMFANVTNVSPLNSIFFTAAFIIIYFIYYKKVM